MFDLVPRWSLVGGGSRFRPVSCFGNSSFHKRPIAAARRSVISSRWRSETKAYAAPPTPDALGHGWSDPHTDPGLVLGDIVHPIRTDPAQIRNQEVMQRRLAPVLPWHATPAVLGAPPVPSSSCPRRSPAAARESVQLHRPVQVLKLALRSGCSVPARVLRWLASYGPCRGGSATAMADLALGASAAANARSCRQRSGDYLGSPRLSARTMAMSPRSWRRCGSMLEYGGFRPPPAWRDGGPSGHRLWAMSVSYRFQAGLTTGWQGQFSHHRYG